MLQRPSTRRPRRKPLIKTNSTSARTEFGRQVDEFCAESDLFFEVKTGSSGKPLLIPKPGLAKATQVNEQAIMDRYGWYWEPLLHDIAYLEQMRDNIALVAGVYQKFTDLVMEGFHVECEEPDDNDEITDILVNDPKVDFSEVVRSAVFQIATIANCYFRPVYTTDADGFRVESFVPIRTTVMRKLRDDNLVVQGYAQLAHRPSQLLFAKGQQPEIHLADEICCGSAYMDGWYAYGKPPLAALPFVAKMKLQMERDLVEMMHQHVPRIDVTYTPDQQMNEDQVAAAMTDAQTQIANLKPTDNYIHTPDFSFEYKGPQGKSLDFGDPMRYVSEQLYAVLPLLSGYLSADLNVNPMIAQQSFRITCSLANYVRSRIAVMFQPVLKKLEDERGCSKIKLGWTDLDAETAETVARTQEYNANNAATNRDAGFIDQDTAAAHATVKSPGGPVKKAAEPGALAPPIDPNKTPPTTGDPKKAPSQGGRSKIRDRGKGPKAANRSAPTPDKRPKAKRHEAAPIEEQVEELRDLLNREE